MLAFIDDMEDVEELKALPTWDAHLLRETVRAPGA
jgi:hypothetical protein